MIFCRGLGIMAILILFTISPLQAQSAESANPPADTGSSSTEKPITDQPLGLAIGLNLYTLVEGVANYGLTLNLPVEFYFTPGMSGGFNFLLNNYGQENRGFGFIGGALWLRFYLLNQGFTEPALALGGLYIQAGIDLEFWWGEWPGKKGLDWVNIGPRLGIGHKFIIAESAGPGLLLQGLYIEPELSYAFRSNWYPRFSGGINLGWSF
jgi:hypothetical protein